MQKAGKEAPLISVIIPVYNVEKYVGKCLDSIIHQTYTNLEIIVVDDGSTDASGKICEDYANKDSRIKVIHQKNGGLSDARNTGIKNAHGQYVGFVDSDDWIEPETYESLYNNIVTYQAGISVCGAKKVHDESQNIKIQRPKILQYSQADYIKRFFKINSQSCEYYAWNKLYKRELLDNTQYPTNLTSEDVLGTYKAILRASTIVTTTQNYYHYRKNEKSITGSFSTKDFDLIKIWDLIIQYTKENAPQYLDYAVINRKRINLTLLYRIAINGAANQEQYKIKVKNLISDLKQAKHTMLQAPISFTRKILTILFCTNYKLTATILYLIKSPYFFLPSNSSSQKKQNLSKLHLLLILISLIIFFEPQAFKEDLNPAFLIQIDNIYKILKLICSGYIVLLYLKKCRLSKFVALTCLFQFVCLLSTIINYGSITRFAGPALTTLVMAMMAEILIHTHNLFPIIRKLLIYFRITFILNLITILLKDTALLDLPIYFLGIDNRWIFTYLPWICFEFLYSVHTQNKFNKISTVMFIMSELTLVWEKSYAAMLLFALWALLLIKPKLPIAKHAISIFAGTIVANFSIVILRIQDAFAVILDKIGKSTTLSGRTFIWDAAIKAAKAHPWLGNGMQTATYDKNYFFTTSNTNLPFLKVPHAHNTYVNTLYRYGGMGLSLFIFILYLPLKKLKTSYTNPYANILTVSIIITLLLGIFDTLDYSGFYFILSCAYGISFIMTSNSTNTKHIKGFKVLTIINRCKKLVRIDINILNYRHNYLISEQKRYCLIYNLIRRRYLKKVRQLPTTAGSGKFSNKVWWCWLQGEDNCPPLQKKCLASLRKHLQDREIIVITKDNLYDYIELPEYIKKKYAQGLITNTHFSDIIRLQLLITHGGTWIDSSVYCTAYDKKLFNQPLFVYKNLAPLWLMNRTKMDQEPLIAESWFITSEIDNPILIATRDLLFDYWKKHNYLINYFLFHYFFTLVATHKYHSLFDQIPSRSRVIPHLLQNECYNEYDEKKITDILQQSPLHKLSQKIPRAGMANDCFYKRLISE